MGVVSGGLYRRYGGAGGAAAKSTRSMTPGAGAIRRKRQALTPSINAKPDDGQRRRQGLPRNQLGVENIVSRHVNAVGGGVNSAERSRLARNGEGVHLVSYRKTFPSEPRP
jgi:hypothetical protein